MPHHGSPDKEPAVRIGDHRGRRPHRVPFTTGILIGIGETVEEIVASLFALADLSAGGIQEVIVQNFRAKADTPMRRDAEPTVQFTARVAAVARWILGGEVNLQVPPNLTERFEVYLDAGINDWGGVSPLTIDWVNPEAPWPHLDELRARTEAAGFRLAPRLPVYPEYLDERWIDPGLLAKAQGRGRRRWLRPRPSGGRVITFCRLRPARGPDARLGRGAARRGVQRSPRSPSMTAETHRSLSRGRSSAGGRRLPTRVPPPGWPRPPMHSLWRTGSRWLADHRGRRRADRSRCSMPWCGTGAAFLRTGRSRVAEAAALTGSARGRRAWCRSSSTTSTKPWPQWRPGQATCCCADWDTERLGHLREALGGRLVERTAFPPGIDRRCRSGMPSTGRVVRRLPRSGRRLRGRCGPVPSGRPARTWSVPKPPARVSAQWADPAWVIGYRDVSDVLAGRSGRDPGPIPRGHPPVAGRGRGPVRGPRGRGRSDRRGGRCSCRQRANGDTVTYVTNRNINYTNQCYFRCGFCAFSKGPRSLNLRGDPYLLEVHEVAFRAKEAADAGATEVCLQGGIHPEFTGDFYVSVVEAVKEVAPDLHIHGFTPLEVWQGAADHGRRRCATSCSDWPMPGLGTLPGTAAEILDDRVRRHLCPDKITTAEWAYRDGRGPPPRASLDGHDHVRPHRWPASRGPSTSR